MPEERPANKGIAVLQTSLFVSFLLAVTMGFVYTFRHHCHLSETISVSYLVFINNLVLPISLAILIQYSLFKSNEKGSLIWYLKKTGTISLLSLILIFIWNSIDIFFSYKLYSSHILLQDVYNQFFTGLILCIPTGLLVTATLSYLNAEQ